MKDHNVNDELLTRYLLNELNGSEEQQVIAWLNESNDNAEYFERLKEAWNLAGSMKLLQETDINNEWNRHTRVVNGGDIIRNVEEGGAAEALTPSPGKRKRLLTAISIAASLLLAVGSYVYLSEDNHSVESLSAHRKAEVPPTSAGTEDNINKEQNNSGMPRNLLLSDGSEIVLYANSEVSYEKDFSGTYRHVYLKGKADFSVTKDSTKPFTVFSGDISTTVLGTKFTVTAFDSSVIASVRLYEGKVVVKSTEAATRRLKRDYVLIPGQEIVYNRRNGDVLVRSFTQPLIGKQEQQVENIEVPDNYKGSWFMFNNQPLPDVFDQLRALYGVDIKYNRRDLDKMYFIGKFDQTDSINQILKKIALLYQLKVSRHDNKYTVTR